MKRKFIEKTLVLLKPDAVERGISGPIIERFERAGLKIIGLKLLRATKEQLEKHFPIHDKSWIKGMGNKSLESYKANSIDPVDELGTSDPLEIGKIILEWNFEYLLSGPIAAIVFEGPRAVSVVRKIVGSTIPANALPGTIRGDFSINTADYSNSIQCSCKNVIHASGTVEEAERECNVWFKPNELVKYERSDERTMFRK